MIDGWWAQPLEGPEAGLRGWDEAALFAHLRQGHAPGIASASAPMAEVVHRLQGLPEADLRAPVADGVLTALCSGIAAPLPLPLRDMPAFAG